MKHISLLKTCLLTTSLCVSLSTFAQADGLPIDKITLSSAGLVQFHHHGSVSNDQDITLDVPVDQVDDVLKSLVVLDKKGQIKSVTLPGKNPIQEQFKNFPFKERDFNNTLSFINSLKGVMVEIQTIDGDFEGRIVSVEAEKQTTNNTTEQTYRVTFLGRDGVRSVPLSSIRSIEIQDENLKTQYNQALDIIATQDNKTNRSVTLSLTGDGKRDVSYSYVVRSPLWKTAYRLVVPTGDQENGYLQGWGILENMSGQDWDNVSLTLTSGAPVTFKQALYESYYKDRPELPVEVFGTIIPRKDAGATGFSNVSSKVRNSMSQNRQISGLDSLDFGGAAPSPMRAEAEMVSMNDMAGLGGQVTVSDESALIEFTLPQSVSLDAGHSMMVPFISSSVSMENIYVYQGDTHKSHPLAAVEFKNEADHGLPPGIVTLYNESSYLGDAEMPVIPAGETRMISYALDTKTTIQSEQNYEREELSLSNVNGVLKMKVRQKQTTEYSIKAPQNEDRTIVLEHPLREGWDIEAPEGAKVEKTDTHWRVHVTLKKGETKNMAITISQQGDEIISMHQLTYDILTRFAAKNADSQTQKLFSELAKIQYQIGELDNDIRGFEQELRQIDQDQRRIRDNYKSVPQNSALAKRYLENLEEQEDRIDAINEKLDDTQAQKQDLEKTFKDRLFKETLQ